MFKLPGCFVLLLVIFCFACNSTKSRPLDIGFSADSSSIVIRNVDPVGMAKIRNGELQDSLLQELVTVLKTPLADDSTGVSLEVRGRVLPEAEALIFKPESPFEKGRDYRVLTYINSRFADLQSVVKGQTKFNMAPNEQVLRR